MNVFETSSGWNECMGDGPLVWNGTAAESVTLSAEMIDIMKFAQIVYTLEAKSDISDTTVTVDTDNQSVSVTRGNAFIPEDEYEVTYGTSAETATADFPTASGKYYAFVTAKADSTYYTGTAKSEAFTVVNAITLTADNVTIADFTYDGTAKTPVLKYGDTALIAGTNYTIAATEGDTTSATAAGTYTIHINGINDYAGENVELSWKINRKAVMITAGSDSKTYDGNPLTKSGFDASALEAGDTHTFTVVMSADSTITDVGSKANVIATVDGVDVTAGTATEVGNYLVTTSNGTLTINKADSTPDAVTGLTAAYGKTLADVTLPTVDGGTWAWDDDTQSVGNVGDNTFSATFTPTDTTNYKAVQRELTVAVTAIPANPAAVGTLNATYGQTLADVALPTVEGGTWAWKDSLTTSVGNAGTQTFKAVYTPTSANYTAIEQNVTVNVAKADPTPDAVTGLTVTYGATLADVALPTGWTWDAPTTSVGNVGDNAFAATYTPDDTDNYNTVQDNLTVTVVPVEKTALNDAITAANTYYDTIEDNADYATPVAALSAAITAANAVYTNDNVTEAEVAQAITDVNNAVTTAKAAVKDIDDTKAAQAVTDQINALPAAADITSADKAAVDAARAAYNALVSPDQAGKVTEATLAKLTAAEKALADHIAADAVIKKINEIGEVALTDDSKALIDAARAAYNTLASDEQKALVSNYKTLTAAEQEYSNLQIKDVESKIYALGEIELKDECKTALVNARAAYNALTADQQALVSNVMILNYAEKLYDALEAKKKAEDEKAAAEKSQAAAEDAAEQAAADKEAAETAQAKAEENAKQAEADKKAAEAAQAKAEATAKQASADKAAAETAQAKAEATVKQALADKESAEAAQTKAEATAKQASADKAVAEAAQAKAEETAKQAAADKAVAEEAQKEAEKALANDEKDAASKVAAAEAAQAKAEATAKQAATDKKAAETAQAAADMTAKQAIADKEAAEKSLAAAEATAKQATADKEAAEKSLAAAEATAKQATADKEAAEAAQAAAETTAKQALADKEAAVAAQAEAEKKSADEKTAADKAAADKVIKLIEAIGKVYKTNPSENKIVAARAAYDTLTDEQKALVTNYIVLTEAESSYDALPQTGMSGIHKVFAGLAALMGITGAGLVKKSRKEDEE